MASEDGTMHEWADDRIGLRAGPYNPTDLDWPTYGYDGSAPMAYTDDLERESAFSREDWLWLCDEMMTRWQGFREAILAAPDKFFTPRGSRE